VTSANSHAASKAHFAYVTEVDVSVDNGRGINEREFVKVLLQDYHNTVTCVLPEPEHPQNFADPAICYVRPHRNRAPGYLPHVSSTVDQIRRVHAERPLDAIVTRLEVTPLAVQLSRAVTGCPLILKTMATYAPFKHGPPIGQSAHRWASWLFRGAFRKTIREALGCDTMSVPFARWIANEFSLDAPALRVIPNGANIDLFKPAAGSEKTRIRSSLGLPREQTLFGYVGILAEQRGLEALLRALARVEHSDVALVLVGDGPLRPVLERLASAAGLGDRVLFMGSIAYGAVPSVMRAFDYGVDLSSTPVDICGDRTYATFSQKLAQYLSCGLQVLAWDLEDTLFISQRGLGRLAERGNHESLAEAMALLAESSPAERAQRGQLARKYATDNLTTQLLTRTRVEWWTTLLESSRDPVGEHP
jgi:glycosyltransferase involved in cell wall biosynthesis